ncbi:MAG: class I SAM-dependent methyltransferase [Acidobacteriota bacterium]|nr:class I SAM-dependent methyltransferase [Acidobacteriota bacterium]
MTPRRKVSFDPIARPYRWLEYLSLGPALMRCRCHFLPHLRHARRALVLGDGDGRFLSRLLRANPRLTATALDSSVSMLHLLQARCRFSTRLSLVHTDALGYQPSTDFDLVVTHFFLDCFPQPEVERLIAQVRPALQNGGLWLLSEFRIPNGPLRPLAQLGIRGLYLAFRLLTGLRTSHLPQYADALQRAGLRCIARHDSLAGLLTTQLWQSPGPVGVSKSVSD